MTALWRKKWTDWAMGGLLAVLVAKMVVPAVVPSVIPPDAWLKVRDIRVDSDTTLVTLDRTIGHLWGDPSIEDPKSPDFGKRKFLGNVKVTIRQVAVNPSTGRMIDDGRPSSSCSSGRYNLTFIAGKPYPRAINDQPLNLAWFMDAPPNAGCILVEGGSYVADFEWTREWQGFELKNRASSNIFNMSRRLDMSEAPALADQVEN